MDYIDSNAPFENNEQVLTSGQGGIFPPGLLIGVVDNFEDYIAGGFKKFRVKPIINFGNLEQVLIIDKKVDQGIKEFSREKNY
jgi:rod shape-determining protein MreC